MFCHMCKRAYGLYVYVYVYVYASVVFKNGKGSFTQCIMVHIHKGV